MAAMDKVVWTVRNYGRIPMGVILEPWATPYSVDPDEAITFEMWAPWWVEFQNPTVDMDYCENCVTVHSVGRRVRVFKDGNLINEYAAD